MNCSCDKIGVQTKRKGDNILDDHDNGFCIGKAVDDHHDKSVLLYHHTNKGNKRNNQNIGLECIENTISNKEKIQLKKEKLFCINLINFKKIQNATKKKYTNIITNILM